MGTVENPQSLLDEFALVVPGTGAIPDPGRRSSSTPEQRRADSLGSDVTTPAWSPTRNVLNPETMVLTLATLGMLLIALVSVGGFTVLAQRRLRAIGMVEAMGATDKNIRLVLRANGVFVGVDRRARPDSCSAWPGLAGLPAPSRVERPPPHRRVRAALGRHRTRPGPGRAGHVLRLGPSRPHHRQGARSSPPWPAGRRLPSSCAARPSPASSCWSSPSSSSACPGQRTTAGQRPPLVLGFVAAHRRASSSCRALALALLAEWVARPHRRADWPCATWLVSGPSGFRAVRHQLGILIAVAHLCRRRRPLQQRPRLRRAEPGLESAHRVHAERALRIGADPALETPTRIGGLAALHGQPASMPWAASSMPCTWSPSTPPDAILNHNGPGRSWSGPVYVATPALLKAFGIDPSAVETKADVLSMRSGLAGVSGLQLVYGKYFQQQQQQVGGPNGPPPQGNGGSLPGPGNRNTSVSECPADSCLNHPVIQATGNLPSGTSAPNTVITEHAIRTLGLQTTPAAWLIQTPSALTASQITDARQAAAAAGMTVETKNSAPSSSEITNWATVFGIALALGVLAMSVGLIRSETAGDLRTLTAAGASAFTRRNVTAVTAGALGLLGAVLGTAAAYVAAAGWLRNSSLNGGLSTLGQVPWFNLFLIIVAMPVVATAIGWLLAGRQPSASPPSRRTELSGTLLDSSFRAACVGLESGRSGEDSPLCPVGHHGQTRTSGHEPEKRAEGSDGQHGEAGADGADGKHRTHRADREHGSLRGDREEGVLRCPRPTR